MSLLAKATSKHKHKDGLCGINPFCTSENDPFIVCCRAHDLAYSGLPRSVSTAAIDKIFLDCILDIAKTDKLLQLRAKTYYLLARNYGRARYALNKLGIKL